MLGNSVEMSLIFSQILGLLERKKFTNLYSNQIPNTANLVNN